MENRVILNGKIVDLFRSKKRFHEEMAKLSFQEKLRLLAGFNKLAKGIKRKKG